MCKALKSNDLFSARHKEADCRLPEALCVSGFASATRTPKPYTELMTVPLNHHEFLQVSLGSARVLSMGPEVKPGMKGGGLLSAHS